MSNYKEPDIKLAETTHIKLYHDSKLFWRERINVELAIYLYLKYDCIEITAYNMDSDIESPKIYCSKSKIYRQLYEFEIEEKVNEIKNDYFMKRKACPPLSELTESIKQNLSVEYICRRLSVKGKSVVSNKFEIELTSISDEIIEDILVQKPEELQPIYIPRKR